jgi:hypothetical protein
MGGRLYFFDHYYFFQIEYGKFLIGPKDYCTQISSHWALSGKKANFVRCVIISKICSKLPVLYFWERCCWKWWVSSNFEEASLALSKKQEFRKLKAYSKRSIPLMSFKKFIGKNFDLWLVLYSTIFHPKVWGFWGST